MINEHGTLIRTSEQASRRQDMKLEPLSSKELFDAEVVWIKHIQGNIRTNAKSKQMQISLGLFYAM